MIRYPMAVCLRAAAVTATVIVLGTVPLIASAANQSGQGGTYQRHRILFACVGCGGGYTLSSQVRAMLEQAGAKLNAPVTFSPGGTALLDFSTLRLAHAGKQGHPAGVTAAWRNVAYRFRRVDAGDPAHPDCHVVYQFKVQLLQMFAARHIRYGLPCATSPPGYFGGYYLKFQVLVPATVAVGKPHGSRRG